MPIEARIDPDGIVVTRLIGTVTDQDLLDHYRGAAEHYVAGRRVREIVDGTAIERMAITPEGQARLAETLATNPALLRDLRCAMVAASDVVYDMFRMWEMQREQLGYELRVFRDAAAARMWLLQDSITTATPPPR